MLKKIIDRFKVTKEVSIVKLFINNPDKFIITMYVEGDEIVLKAKRKETEVK